VAVGPIALLLIALIKNRGEQLDLGRLGSVSQLGFGLVLMALGVVYYFVVGRASSPISSVAREPYDLKELPVEKDKP
jgi:uncharacterized membrane protein (DUF373 family)